MKKLRGWGVNFYALLEKLRIVGDTCLTEDDFLMPTPTLRKILENRLEMTQTAEPVSSAYAIINH